VTAVINKSRYLTIKGIVGLGMGARVKTNSSVRRPPTTFEGNVRNSDVVLFQAFANYYATVQDLHILSNQCESMS
jgi:hypothetical protein